MTTDTAIKEGNLCLRNGEYSQAARYFSKALENDPQNVTALNNRAVALIALKQYERAYEDAARAIKYSQGRRADSYIIRATLYRLLDKPEKALADVNRAIILDPQEPKAYRLRAELHSSQGRQWQADRDLKAAERWEAQAGR